MLRYSTKLAAELAVINKSLDLEQAKKDKLAEKLSKLSDCNVNKRLQHRDDQIISLKEQIKEKNKLKLTFKMLKKSPRDFKITFITLGNTVKLSMMNAKY